jgi:hypothetical protein
VEFIEENDSEQGADNESGGRNRTRLPKLF